MVRWGMVGLAMLAVSGCAVEKVSTPAPTGPAEFAVSLAVSVTPDVIRQDGTSTSTVGLHARDGAGLGIAGLTIRLDVLLGSMPVDFGTLMNRTLTTDSGGRASTTYQAPAAPLSSVDTDTRVTIRATILGSNYANSTPRTAEIRLVPPGIILPPNGAPVPRFFVSPTSGREEEPLLFDGSGSTDDGTIVAYDWTFGDGAKASGKTAWHAYFLAGTYFVTLKVTDDRGLSASTAPTPITIGAASLPVAAFTISPTAPTVGQPVILNAAPSTVAHGRYLVGWDWDFGNGKQASGVTAHTSYDLPGSYTIVLTVTDNTGRKAVTSRTLTVSEPEL